MAYRKYKAIRQRYATNKSVVEKILSIFARTGSDEVISYEIAGDHSKVMDFMILSDNMREGLNKISLEIDHLLQSPTQNFGHHFYFSKYGGSKTQFIAMLNDYFIREKPKVIPITLVDITAINSENMFNQIIPRTYEKINQEIEDRYKTYEKILEIQKIASLIQIGLIGNKNKNEILKKLKNIDGMTSNNVIKEEIIELEKLTDNIQIADDERVMDLLSKIIADSSKLGFIYVLFFDEIDLWFNEEEPLEFSKKFIEKTRIIKKILDFYKGGGKLYFLFCCTDRIFYLLTQHSKELEGSSPVYNRFLSIFDNSDRTFENGTYGEQLEDAVCQISAYFSLVKQTNISEDYLETIIKSYKNKYYESTRRILNSRLIFLLNSYKEIINLIEIGLKHIKNNNWIWIGNIVPEFLEGIFKELGINWIKEEIPVDESLQRSARRLDGKFVVGEIDRKVILTEVKTVGVRDFPKKKVEQVVEAVHFRQEPIILLIWGKFKKEEVISKITSYININMHIGYKLEYINKIFPIIIDNPIAFAPIIGLSTIRTDTNALKRCMTATANWLDELSSIREDLFEVWQELGIVPKFQKRSEDIEDGEEKVKEKEKKKKKNIISQNAITVLITLKKKNQYTKTGTKKKSTVYNTIRSLGFGIEKDLDRVYELLYKKRIISNITTQTVKFSSEFINRQLTINTGAFEKYCEDIVLNQT